MEKQSKGPVWQFRMVVAVALCLLLLCGLGYYLWTFDYKPNLPMQETPPGVPAMFKPSLPMQGTPPSAPAVLKASLRINDSTEFYQIDAVDYVEARFTIMNNGPARVRLVDTQAEAPLYDVQLFYRAAGGGLTPVWSSASSQAGGVTAAHGYDPAKDSVIELLPNSAVTRILSLSKLREGEYKLTVVYRPRALAQRSGQAFAALQVDEQELKASAEFKINADGHLNRPSPQHP